MRILFFGTYFQFRGKETYVSEEIDSVIKFYPNVEYLIYTVGPFNKKNQIIWYKKNVLWVRRKNLKEIKTFLLFLKDMITIFKKFKPNVIHSIYVIESILMGVVGKIFRVPSIFHSRGMDFNYDPFISIKSNILARIAAKLNRVVLTVSKVMKSDGSKLNIPQKKIITIYDGIDYDLFDPDKLPDKAQNKILQILHVGRFEPVKCHDLIIETAKELKDNGFNFNLSFCGYGSQEKHIKDLISKFHLNDCVKVVGYVDHDELPQYLAKADLFILPSLSEGMPISVLEAMSMNLPVILTRVGGMSELIQNDRGGILIDVNNKKQLYNAILSYIKKPEKIKIDGKINREFVLKHFNWKIHAKRLYNLYSKLSKKF